MAKGAISVTDAEGTLIAADVDRREVILQHISGDPVFLEFGSSTATVDQGLVLSSTFPVIVIDDGRAALAIKGICDSGLTATGTYTTRN